jgi:tRNA G18 (ribose-2'-O)-methylase SpoU
MTFFNKKKFLTFPLKQQHKKCAELLEEAFTKNDTLLFTHYCELRSWLGIEHSFPFSDKKALLDAMHEHYMLAGISRQEHSLISTHFDNDSAKPFLPNAIYLEGLRSLHNIGAIMRTTEAFRLGSIYYNGYAELPIPKSAMGCEKWVSFQTVDSFTNLPRPLIVLETIPTSIPYYDFDFPSSFTLAVGNEEYGCSDALIQAADACIQIPLFGRKNSLNVASAFAIVASEIVRKNSLK